MMPFLFVGPIAIGCILYIVSFMGPIGFTVRDLLGPGSRDG